MKTSNLLLLLPLVLLGCKETANTPTIAPSPLPATEEIPAYIATLEVSNPSTFARPDTLISFSLNQLGATAGPLQVWNGEVAMPTGQVQSFAFRQCQFHQFLPQTNRVGLVGVGQQARSGNR